MPMAIDQRVNAFEVNRTSEESPLSLSGWVGTCLLRKQGFACFDAAAAGFGADPAVFHLGAVLFAHCPADLACFNAGSELGAGKFEISPGKARHDPSRDQADIRAIGAIANTLDHFAHVFLAEAGVGAGVARFGAGIAGGDALDVGGVVR